jgi:phosphomannomutase
MIDETLAAAATWLAQDPDAETRDELTQLIAQARAGDPVASDDLTDRFSTSLEFGTAGLRGILGAGPARMNRVLVQKVSAGLGEYLRRHIQGAAERGVVIGYDARKNSRIFAEDAAAILAGAGFTVHLAHRPWPTPVTAWALLDLHAAAAVMVTASHNPPEYNGYKVYWENGAQIIAPHDQGIAACAAAVPRVDGLPRAPSGIHSERIHWLTESTHDAYLKSVGGLRVGHEPRRPLRIAYTPLHGVGASSVEPLFAAAGYDLRSEPSQRDPDPQFPTVAFPNPEEPGAMDRVLALAKDISADLVLANDPDADRLCVAIPDGAGGFTLLSGDQVGALLADYLLVHTPARPCLVATTLVSSQLLRALAASHGSDYRETLTGFKWIANGAMQWQARTGGTFVMGYEEALGYTVGSLVRDKDGVSAALIMADLAAWNLDQGRSIHDHLVDVYRRVGLFATLQVSWTASGPEAPGGLDKLAAVMTHFRAAPPSHLGALPVERIVDLLHGHGDLPPSDVLVFHLAGGHRVIMRPSGTEPKLKSYYEVSMPLAADEDVAHARARGVQVLAELRSAHQALLQRS